MRLRKERKYVMLDKKISGFFKYSIITVLLVCIIVFTILTFYMSGQTESSIKDISEIYMKEMSSQIQQKFETVIDLRLSQLKGIIQRTPPDAAVYGDELIDELRVSADVRDITYLSIYSSEGEAERITGEHLNIINYDNILGNLNKETATIGFATNDKGEKYLILAEAAEYPLKDGTASVALIAGISMQYLNEALFLDEKNAMAYSHVISKDGTFLIRSGDAYRDNYFNRLQDIVEDLDGKSAEDYIRELKEAIAADKDYSAVLLTEGEKRHLFASPVSGDIDWYLISIMPSGILDERLSELDVKRVIIMIGSSLIILITMMVIFIIYYRFSRQQMIELNKAEKEAVQANIAKSEFLSSMSHDIRTPMNAIIGMTEIALRNVQNNMRVEDCLQKVRLSSKHLLGLINDVLDMSKIESGKMTLNISEMSLREAMDDIVNIMQPQVKEHSQYFDIFIQDIDVENVYCDGVRLNQVILNLLSNAVKFTPTDGRIDVHLYQEASPLGEQYIRTHFKVEDTGIGMSEEFQKKIFDTFSREEENEKVQRITGTGLGMSITKSIIDLMGGTIELRSEQGKGTQFHVILDFKKADIGENDMRLPEWNVLVVDDNEMLCLSAAANLEALGVHAEWTLDGMKAVEMIAEHHKQNNDYHFVLIDWKMPNMDGIETIQEIHARVGKDIPIFLISAYDQGELEDMAFENEIEGFISKPLFKSTLFARLRQYVDGLENGIDGENEQIDFQGKRVLLAEDIEINWEIANEILSAAGLVLEWAENGQICVDRFAASEPGYYNAILMDVRMPVMNGYDATKTIRKMDRPDKDLPIIAMTADAFSDDAQRCFECGMDAHLTKPLDIRECMRTLQNYLK